MASMPFAPKISLFVLKLLMRESSGGATKVVVGIADAFALLLACMFANYL